MWGVALFRAPSLLRFVLRKTKGKRGELKVALALRLTGHASLNNVILPDGRGGLTQVDHLVRLPVGIAVIETKNYAGRIVGREREGRWAQVLGRRSFSFQNPLRQNYLHVEAVRAIIPAGVDVLGHVVFVGSARFQERPPGVSGLWELYGTLKRACDLPVPADVMDAWEVLKQAARTDFASRRAHLRQVRARL